MPIKCGANKVEITPEFSKELGPIYVAGYASMEAPMFEGVHDPIYARILVLSSNKTKIALISVEVIGLFNEYIETIKEDLRAFGFEKTNYRSFV